MKKNILPKGWEISKIAVTLTDFTDIDNPQIVRVQFIDEAAGFFTIIDTETETMLDVEELEKLTALAKKMVKTLDYLMEQSIKESRK
jgi:hypothetical protein